MSSRFPFWAWIAIPAAFVIVAAAERRRPLRRQNERWLPHLVRNCSLGGVSAVILLALQTPLVIPLSRWVEHWQFGLLHRFALPASVRLILGIVLLDYTLWFWHWANHRVAWLWRFHEVHHVDRDVDASTALRFHFGELVLSIGYRAAQILVTGANPLAVTIWQALLMISTFFHHSNLRLPLGVEAGLVRCIVTPRMHGIHHSDRQNETDSNWSSLLSIWDFLHGTMRLNVPQEEIRAGIPAFAEREKTGLLQCIVMPFRRHPASWLDPDGTPAKRAPFPGNRSALAP